MKLLIALIALGAWGQDKPFVPGCLNGAIRYTPASTKWEECKENKWVQIGEATSPDGPVTVYPEHQKTLGQQVAEEIILLEMRIAALEKRSASQAKTINTITAILAEAAVHARALEKRIVELERKGAKGQ